MHSLVVLAEELGTFLLRKTFQDHLRVARILVMDRLAGHVAESAPAI